MKEILLLDNNILVYLYSIFKNGSNRELKITLEYVLKRARANAVWIPSSVISEFLSVRKNRDKRESFLQKVETILKQKGIDFKECLEQSETSIKSLMEEFENIDRGEADAHTQATALASMEKKSGILGVKFLTNDRGYLHWVSKLSTNFEVLDWNDICKYIGMNMGCRK